MTIREIFEGYTLKTDGNGKCWIWEGNVGNHGYGRINLLGNNILTHRFSYELYQGLVPDDKCVLHKCHNRLCVNPEHLYLGDAKDNARDWIEARSKDTLISKTLSTPNKESMKTIHSLEKDLILNTLNDNKQCRTYTAKQLGISTTTLWRKIKKYKII